MTRTSKVDNIAHSGGTTGMTIDSSGRILMPNVVAWFVGKTLFNESLLCRTCWKDQFNRLTESEKKEYSFYGNKN